MMGLAGRTEIAARLQVHGWSGGTRAALVCGMSTPDQWTWTGRLSDIGAAAPPEGVPGVMIVGEVVAVGEALASAHAERSATQAPGLAKVAQLEETYGCYR
jgi:siroheme synthase